MCTQYLFIPNIFSDPKSFSNSIFVKLQVLGPRLGVDFTFTLDNNDNNNANNYNNDNDNDNNNPHLNFFKGTVLGVKEQAIRDKGYSIRHKGQGIRPKWSLTLKTKSCNIV